MPIYDYHCQDCKESFELFVRSINAPVEVVCPRCGSRHVEKGVTAASTVGGRSGALAAAAACAPSG